MSERGVVFRSQALEKEVYRRICGFMEMVAVYYIVLVVSHQKLSSQLCVDNHKTILF